MLQQSSVLHNGFLKSLCVSQKKMFDRSEMPQNLKWCRSDACFWYYFDNTVTENNATPTLWHSHSKLEPSGPVEVSQRLMCLWCCGVSQHSENHISNVFQKQAGVLLPRRNRPPEPHIWKLYILLRVIMGGGGSKQVPDHAGGQDFRLLMDLLLIGGNMAIQLQLLSIDFLQVQ